MPALVDSEDEGMAGTPSKGEKKKIKMEQEVNGGNGMDEGGNDEPPVTVKRKREELRAASEAQKSSSPASTSTARKKKKKKSEETPKIVKSEQGASSSTGGRTKELKKLDKAERIQYALQSFLWWNAIEPPEGCQWVTMEHAGVSFPETYQPHGVQMKYDGNPIVLTPIQEEA